MRRRPVLTLFAALAATSLLAGCGGSSSGTASDGSAAASGGSSAGALRGGITVLAAASLTEAFTKIGTQFEAAHPGTKVTFSFGASSALATQITQGAPADVFASASKKTMDTVIAAGAAGAATPFVDNVMAIAVPPSNPAKITGVADLARPGVKVALCQPEVPCGVGARAVFEKASITVKPVTEETDVKATLAKVQLGEVDAAVVYATDVLAAGDKVKGVPVPDAVNAATTYPIAALKASKNAPLATAFVDYVRSAAGLKVLTEAGFQSP